MHTRKATATGAALAVAAVAAALTVGDNGTPIQRPAPAPVAEPVSLALAAQTSEQLSYYVALRAGRTGEAPTLTLEGGFDPIAGNAFVRDVANLKFTEQRLVGGACWVNTGGRWQQTPSPCFRGGVGTTAGYFADPRGLLDELKSTGHTTYAGRSNGVDRWTFTSADQRDHITLTYNGTVELEVATSRVLSVEFTETVPGETVTSTITVSYHDYGAPVVVTAP